MIRSCLDEYTRTRLVAKAKRDTPERYKRRTDSGDDWKFEQIDLLELQSTGDLSLTFRVKTYRVQLKILKYSQTLDQYLTGKYSKDIRKAIRKSVEYAMKYNHIQVVCDCPDFKYRFAYMATQKGYGLDTHEDRPANITNPRSKGGLCKHIMRVVNAPSQWMPRVVTAIRGYVKNL